MHSNKIRQLFLSYFKGKGHTVVPSASLIPINDPTLLFTNAGMVPFKDIFLGKEKCDYVRATSAQRCIRAGGKHNDLENVGYTARHHTFFEMLGNFSFGDYFKREAIQYAWDFLTNELKIPAEKLWVTVYKDDSEAADIWLNEMKIDASRFSRCGDEDNFWSMGDVGPCGPCSEIFYDHGPQIAGGPPGTPEQEGDRYVEIWNLVFMQYNRAKDGTMTQLPQPSVDTGMGLERVAAVMQGVQSNYDIALFQALIQGIAKLGKVKDVSHSSLRVIADHIRSTSFLIAEGIVPSNEGRGYVLRRIVRRAIRHGHALGFKDAFFYKLVPTLIEFMGEAYPMLVESEKKIQDALKLEEKQFAKTLDQGLSILFDEIKQLKTNIIPGDIVFKLYDTYGFPSDLTADIAREHALTVDMLGFEKCMSKQRQRSQQASQFESSSALDLAKIKATEFTGYDAVEDDAHVIALFTNDRPIDILKEGESGTIILNKTPFYGEAGGQVGDNGQLIGKSTTFKVMDTHVQAGVYLHHGKVLHGNITLKEKLHAKVSELRKATMLNHSATHLLHAALRQCLGQHAKQKGSLVDPERLRFDFCHTKPLTREEISAVEKLVNEKIRDNLPATITIMSPDEAKRSGAIGLFEDKYGDKVRVLEMGEFSKELCGGTHAERTGDIGLIKIINETGIAAGVRRIEALTGEAALQWIDEQQKLLNQAAEILKSTPAGMQKKLMQFIERNQTLEKQLQSLQKKNAASLIDELLASAETVGSVKLIATTVQLPDVKALRTLVDQLKSKLDAVVVVLAQIENGRVHLVAGTSKVCAEQYPANTLLQFVAKQVDGKAGGRTDMAQGGGTDVVSLGQALESVADWLKQQ